MSENLNDTQTKISPYTPTLTCQQNPSTAFKWLMFLFGALPAASAVLLALMLVLRPDLEQYLKDSMPGRHMPDAFDHLNDSIPIFVALLTISLALLFAITMKRRYSLVLPLFAGPAIGLVGWFVTENFHDPNWFHFVAISIIGMLVSCLVTSVLAVLPRKTTEPSVAPKPRSRAV